ncbi:MAG: hypothetical protein KH050_01415 [Clostridiaceae bacterium]|nr:hypothetical protein [Clostridiaceae bacterium]
MSKGHIILGIALFAVVTAILYIWGLRKSMYQQQDLTRVLYNRCGNKVIQYLKKHETVSEEEISHLIDGVTASEFWSRKRLTVQEPRKFAGQVITFLLDQQYIEPAGRKTYRLKK